MNRKEAVESLGALMGLKGLGTRWVIEPECGGGREGSQRVGLGMGDRRDVYQAFSDLGKKECEKPRGTGVWSRSSEREKKKIKKETRKIGVVEGEPGVQVGRESGTTGVLESGDMKEKN